MIHILVSIQKIIENEQYDVDNIGMSDSSVYLFADKVLKIQNTDDEADNETFGKDGFKNPQELLEWLIQNRPEKDLVLSHGDFCLPNLFFYENKVSGFIDLGKTCVADRYQDIALCYRSLIENFNGSYGGRTYKNMNAERFFNKLGIEPDWKKIKYYILLDELF